MPSVGVYVSQTKGRHANTGDKRTRIPDQRLRGEPPTRSAITTHQGISFKRVCVALVAYKISRSNAIQQLDLLSNVLL